jgi:hypothetical protein
MPTNSPKRGVSVVHVWRASLGGVTAPDAGLTPVLTSVDGKTLLDRAVYVEDATGGYFTRVSGAAVLDAQGVVIARPTLSKDTSRNPLKTTENLSGMVAIMGGLHQGINDKLRGTAVLGIDHRSDVSAAARRNAVAFRHACQKICGASYFPVQLFTCPNSSIQVAQ